MQSSRAGQVSMLTFKEDWSSELVSSARGCVQRQWPRMLMAREIGWSSRLA